MSISAGLVVANLYYNQPLLHLISLDFSVSDAAVSNVALATQLGYVFGLLFIIPLGDKIANHHILKYAFVVMIIALVAAGFSQNLLWLVVSSFFIGFSSAVPQLFVPMAAQLSTPENRGKSIGIVMSGLLIGILGSRVLSGLVGAEYGWRIIYYAGAVIMLVLYFVLRWKLPKINPTYTESYGSLMKSLYFYFRTEPALRLATLRGALGFAGLSAFWTTLVFLLEDNFGYGAGIAGTFGLFGIAGALGAAVVGKLNDKLSKNLLIILGTIILLGSWILFYFSSNSVLGLIIGVVLIDLGLQAVHITNQNIIFARNQEARNRVNTIYMVGFFVGGAIGTFLGAIAWKQYQWAGVSVLGIILSLAILVSHYAWGRKSSSKLENS